MSFREPVEINPCVTYIASARLKVRHLPKFPSQKISISQNFLLDSLTFVAIFKLELFLPYENFQGPDSHYGTKGLRRIVHQSPSTGVITFQFTYAAGNNNGTSVEDGQIPEIIFCTKII